jgi:hypothetical protein
MTIKKSFSAAKYHPAAGARSGAAAVLAKRKRRECDAWRQLMPAGKFFRKNGTVLRKMVGDCTPVFFANSTTKRKFGGNSSRVK